MTNLYFSTAVLSRSRQSLRGHSIAAGHRFIVFRILVAEYDYVAKMYIYIRLQCTSSGSGPRRENPKPITIWEDIIRVINEAGTWCKDTHWCLVNVAQASAQLVTHRFSPICCRIGTPRSCVLRHARRKTSGCGWMTLMAVECRATIRIQCWKAVVWAMLSASQL